MASPMIAQFIALLDLPEHRRSRWSPEPLRQAAINIKARREHTLIEEGLAE